jgi:glycyl-tRNA synthetase beta chain
MPADLVFEIGCEEIPAKMLAGALAGLPPLVDGRLAAARLAHAGVRALGTPRRLAVIVRQLADRQPDLREEVVGPPASAAFAADGSLTKAGQGFAQKNGVAPQALAKKEVPGKKGLYVVATRHAAGEATRALLPALLGEVAQAIPWPKSMRWGWSEVAFVRPVQWLVAVYGGEVVPLHWAGATAGRQSRGHRFLSPGPVEIASADRYIEALRAAHVVVDPDVRRDLVRAELARLARETGLDVRADDALLGEVIHLGEYPVGVTGHFDPAYLEVPEEVIVTAMRNHQRYFALETKDGRLANRFATMMATVVKDPAVVARGNETVLASRLADAKFFFAEDRKKSFEQWIERLDAVVFQAKLGKDENTVGNKIGRVEALVGALVDRIACDRDVARRAAHLAKADLASSMVGEFPELQGVMGKHYARLAGFPLGVATAIEEHYWPKGQGGALPSTVEGALVAMADRLDTLVGCFAVGLAPSGSADPFGLRRAAIGILAILLDRGPGGPRYVAGTGWPLNVDALIDAAAVVYRRGDKPLDVDAARAPLREFFRARLRGLLVEEGLRGADIDVVLGADAGDPCDARTRAKDVAVVPDAAREVFKRIANILDDAKAKHYLITGEVKPALFASSDGVEARLWRAFCDRRARLAAARIEHRYRDAFTVLAELGPDVAAFFDKGGVMVMDPDPALRENRLSLLQQIYEPFARIADFRLLGGAS